MENSYRKLSSNDIPLSRKSISNYLKVLDGLIKELFEKICLKIKKDVFYLLTKSFSTV